MKGCSTIQKNKKICAIVLLILIFGAFVGITIATVVTPIQHGSYTTDLKKDDFTFPDIIGYGSDGFTSHVQPSASIPAVTGIVLESSKLEQVVNLSNPSENQCIFVISLYLGDGTCLFRTEPVYPGGTVDTVTLNRELGCGHYSDAIIVYDCYSIDGTMRALTRCELVIEITSQ